MTVAAMKPDLASASRDEKRELLADQLAKFRALGERLGAKAWLFSAHLRW